MKENIIQAVVAAMQRDLDCRQMARLKAVLEQELQGLNIEESKDTKDDSKGRNEELLDAGEFCENGPLITGRC